MLAPTRSVQADAADRNCIYVGTGGRLRWLSAPKIADLVQVDRVSNPACTAPGLPGWQALVGVGYRFGWGETTLALRSLSYDFDDKDANLRFTGPALGVTFRC